ncbi:MAG TPA: methionine--tRNA ligase subunit beta, partial [Candidatus Thermoplasmatota archaeon]|nr:methionine--tRNA ligase subunit beta [Candidatus Thermoplasmatota archaeon]
LEAASLKDALKDVIAIARLGNLRLQEQAPWSHLKQGDEGRSRAGGVLRWHLRVVKTLAAATAPYLPDLSDAVWSQLGEKGPSPRARSEKADPGVDHWPRRLLDVAPGQRFGEVKPLVRKLDLKAVLAEFQPAAPAAPPTETKPMTTPAAPAKPQITIDDFAKLDLRVGTVLSCEPHPKADKIWVLQVDLGAEKRQILAGLREHVKAEDLLGRQVTVIANLAPRQIRGLESQGMVLAAEADGVVAPLTPTRSVSPGAGVK